MSVKLPHLNSHGAAHMVDVGAKPATERRARAEAFVRMSADALSAIKESTLQKGDALAVARIAGIQAAKRTADWIPLAHPISLTHSSVVFEFEDTGIRIKTCTQSVGSTGVEMEALTSASAAALSVYDMAKKLDRGMSIEGVRLLEKTGGQSGTFLRE